MAKIKFVGSHIQHGILKAGIAFYAEAGKDESFVDHFVWKPVIPPSGIPDGLEGEALQTWLDALPKKQELNPTFTHFIRVDPTTTLSDLKAEIKRIFPPDVLASADTFLHRRDLYEAEFKATKNKARWEAGRKEFSKYRKMMAARERLGNGLVLPKGYDAEGLITAANNRFRGLGGGLDSKGKILAIKPDTLTVGAAATDRGSSTRLDLNTLVGKENPAGEAGEIVSNEIWLYSKTGATNIYVGSFSASGNDLTVRDSESIGDVATGSKQTQSGLTVNIESGDYWGAFDKGANDSSIESDTSGGSDVWWFGGECIDPTDSETFGVLADDTISLYGEGDRGWTGKISGVTNPAKIMGVDVANIASVKGVA